MELRPSAARHVPRYRKWDRALDSAPDQVGPQLVVLRARDPEGAGVTQSFTIVVRGINRPPLITSVPPTEGVQDVLYTYAVMATDPEHDPVTLTLTTNPAGMSWNPATGLIQWTPSSLQLGSQDVAFTVDDGRGGVVTQSYTILVTDTPIHHPPFITSQPPRFAVVNGPYQFAVQATDPDGNPMTFALVGSPSGITISSTGLVQWTPTQSGTFPVTITVTDDQGGQATLHFTLTVSLDHPPVITSTAVPTVTAGLPYRYDVFATDADSDPLTYDLVNSPQGMTIDARGRITWLPGLNMIGTYPVQAVVTDPYGASDTQNFTITTTGDIDPPDIDLQMSANPSLLGSTVVIHVSATDNVGVTALTLTVNGVPRPLDAAGTARFTATAAGTYAVVATAYDAATNTASATGSLDVLDPSLLNPPDVAITSPIGGTEITSPADVIGTVSSAGLMSWTLTVVPADGSPEKMIATGTTEVTDAVLGRLDSTMLADGPYTLRLTAVDAGGHVGTDETKVSVTGNFKLGNFNMSFTDLTIPVAGIPIIVSRTYDTLDAGKSGDFGYGWHLNLADAQLTVDAPFSPFPNLYPPYPETTRIYVTMPGGQREGFTFYLRREADPNFADQNVYLHPEFQSDPGVTDRLSVPDISLTLSAGQDAFYSTFGTMGYTPTDPFVAGDYTLTTKQGIAYAIDPDTGKFKSATDRNGNQLTFTDDGITSNRGTQITFERDVSGRITRIIDPAGNSVRYAYDANGNLTSFTDRLGNVTHFVYRTDVAHYLDSVLDPLGRPAARTDFYADGRIKDVTDASGKTIQYSYNTNTLVQHVTDQLGNITEIDQDANGNVIRQVSPDGVVTLKQYNGLNLVTSLTTVTPQGNLTTTNAYDADGNVTSTTNPDGTTTRTYYNSYGEPTSQVDAAGNATTNTFDSTGKLTQVTASTGVVTSFRYASGNPSQAYNSDGQLLVNNTYDGFGNVTSTTPAAGRQTFSAYDAEGNQIATWYFASSGSGGSPPPDVQVLDLTFYDAAGASTGTEHVVLPQGQFITANFATATIPSQYITQSTSTTYDPNGKVLGSTDASGLVTQNTYDLRGELIQVRQEAVANGSIVWLDTPHDLRCGGAYRRRHRPVCRGDGRSDHRHYHQVRRRRRRYRDRPSDGAGHQPDGERGVRAIGVDERRLHGHGQHQSFRQRRPAR